MPAASTRSNRSLLIKVIAVFFAVLACAVLFARGMDMRSLVNQGLELIRNAGPVAFFTGMALLPAVGAPMLAFTLPAVPIFGPQLGTSMVVMLSLLAVTTNLTLTYGLARRGFRPVLSRLLEKLNYRLPEVEEGDATDLVIILRVTPGIPFVVQNYLAGLAKVAFGKYVLVSCVIAWPLNTAFLIFGDALLQGKGRAALISISVLVALTAATHMVRKHYSKRSASREKAG